MTVDTLRIGDRVRFEEERNAYSVRAVGERFAICTKPFACQQTVLYTVIDCVNGIRSTEDLVFGLGAETDEQCQEMCRRLESGESGLSRRNAISLQIVSVVKAN